MLSLMGRGELLSLKLTGNSRCFKCADIHVVFEQKKGESPFCGLPSTNLRPLEPAGGLFISWAGKQTFKIAEFKQGLPSFPGFDSISTCVRIVAEPPEGSRGLVSMSCRTIGGCIVSGSGVG